MTSSQTVATDEIPLAEFSADELEFLRQLFDSDIAVTLKNVEVVASVKRKVQLAVAARATPG